MIMLALMYRKYRTMFHYKLELVKNVVTNCVLCSKLNLFFFQLIQVY